LSDEPIISTKDRPGEYDALETAKEGEPIFVLQGGDPLSSPTIHHWVALYRAQAAKEENREKREAMLRKATAAETVAWAMDEYRRGELAAGRTEDRDHGLDGSERSAILARGADRVYNAIAELTDLAAVLFQQDEAAAADLLEASVRSLKVAVEEFEPRRHLRGERADG
jgi:hypothetical protein